MKRLILSLVAGLILSATLTTAFSQKFMDMYSSGINYAPYENGEYNYEGWVPVEIHMTAEVYKGLICLRFETKTPLTVCLSKQVSKEDNMIVWAAGDSNGNTCFAHVLDNEDGSSWITISYDDGMFTYAFPKTQVDYSLKKYRNVTNSLTKAFK